MVPHDDGRMEERDWPPDPPNPKSVRTPPKEGCLDWLFKAVVVPVAIVVLAIACGGSQKRDEKGDPNCVNAGGRPVPCPSDWGQGIPGRR